MKSWHIILIGIFLVIIVGMVIQYRAAAKLADVALAESKIDKGDVSLKK